MEEAQGFLGHPEVGFFSMLLIGVIAGWIAEKVTESDHTCRRHSRVLCGRGACQSSKDPGVWLHSDFGSCDRGRDLDSVCMASGTPAGLTRRDRRQSPNGYTGGGEVICAWINCRAATR